MVITRGKGEVDVEGMMVEDSTGTQAFEKYFKISFYLIKEV